MIDVVTLGASDRPRAYALRYRVLYEGDGDARYADHERREYRDRNDDAATHVLAAVAGDNIVGTVRLTVRRDVPLIGDEHYQWDELATRLACARQALLDMVCVMDRAVVLPEHRGRGVMAAMYEVLSRIAVARRAPVIVGAAAPTNVASQAMLTALGFELYGRRAGGATWQGDHFVADLRQR